MSARPITLGALGKRFGISRERVRQLELRAVAKLRTFCNGGVIDATPRLYCRCERRSARAALRPDGG